MTLGLPALSIWIFDKLTLSITKKDTLNNDDAPLTLDTNHC
jgi:hypothetical protein